MSIISLHYSSVVFLLCLFLHCFSFFFFTLIPFSPLLLLYDCSFLFRSFVSSIKTARICFFCLFRNAYKLKRQLWVYIPSQKSGQSNHLFYVFAVCCVKCVWIDTQSKSIKSCYKNTTKCVHRFVTTHFYGFIHTQHVF